MAEPLAASSSLAAPERDTLLATKLHMPRPRQGTCLGRGWWSGSMTGWPRGWSSRTEGWAAVSHVLGKLGAANRTEAVTRARELGLTP